MGEIMFDGLGYLGVNFYTMYLSLYHPTCRWIFLPPVSRNYGNNHGYPERDVQTPMQRNRMAAVARAFIDDQLLIGRSTTHRYIAYVLDSQQNTLQISGSYDILVVDDACSTAWVPYSAGEPIPVVAEEDELSRARYIVGPKNPEYLYFSTYNYGENEAHYLLEGSFFSFTDMFMLVALV